MGALRAEQDNSGERRRRQGNVSAEHAEGEAAPEHLPRAQPPAQQDGRPPVGHGARVTSWGRGTSFANPLGFGKLRALPQLGAAGPPPPVLAPLQLGQGTAPGTSCAGFLGRASPRGGFPPLPSPRPRGCAALTATSCTMAEPAPWHRPAQNPREKPLALGDPNPLRLGALPRAPIPPRAILPGRSPAVSCAQPAPTELTAWEGPRFASPLPGFGSI